MLLPFVKVSQQCIYIYLIIYSWPQIIRSRDGRINTGLTAMELLRYRWLKTTVCHSKSIMARLVHVYNGNHDNTLTIHAVEENNQNFQATFVVCL